jgi:hypothetical protein
VVVSVAIMRIPPFRVRGAWSIESFDPSYRAERRAR